MLVVTNIIVLQYYQYYDSAKHTMILVSTFEERSLVNHPEGDIIIY